AGQVVQNAHEGLGVVACLAGGLMRKVEERLGLRLTILRQERGGVRQLLRVGRDLGEPVEALIELQHECSRLGEQRAAWWHGSLGSRCRRGHGGHCCWNGSRACCCLADRWGRAGGRADRWWWGRRRRFAGHRREEVLWVRVHREGEGLSAGL